MYDLEKKCTLVIFRWRKSLSVAMPAAGLLKEFFSQVLYFSLEVCFGSWVSWLGAYFWVNCKDFQYINITIMLSGYYNFVSYENELKDEEAWGKRVTVVSQSNVKCPQSHCQHSVNPLSGHFVGCLRIQMSFGEMSIQVIFLYMFHVLLITLWQVSFSRIPFVNWWSPEPYYKWLLLLVIYEDLGIWIGLCFENEMLKTDIPRKHLICKSSLLQNLLWTICCCVYLK